MLKRNCLALLLAAASSLLGQNVTGSAIVTGVGGVNAATRPTQEQIAALYNPCLIHAWPMNDAAGTVFHDVFGTDSMTVSGTVTWQANGTLPGLTPYFNGAGYAVGSESTDTNFDGSEPFTNNVAASIATTVSTTAVTVTGATTTGSLVLEDY